MTKALLFRRAIAMPLVAACAMAPWPVFASQKATPAEVKAAYLYNFARFTEWPPDAFIEPSAPFVIGVAGDEVLRQTVDLLTRGKAIGGRPLRTRSVSEPSDVVAVQILFIGGASASRAHELLKEAGRLPVLTVGDAERFCQRGGMICLSDRAEPRTVRDSCRHNGAGAAEGELTRADAGQGHSRKELRP